MISRRRRFSRTAAAVFVAAATTWGGGLFAADPMEERGAASLRVLDKITARTSAIEIKVDQTATFGSLRVTLRACRQNPPTEPPEAAAFLEIADESPEGTRRVFSGWMFASSPALSAMEHAVYDVWVLGCVAG